MWFYSNKSLLRKTSNEPSLLLGLWFSDPCHRRGVMFLLTISNTQKLIVQSAHVTDADQLVLVDLRPGIAEPLVTAKSDAAYLPRAS